MDQRALFWGQAPVAVVAGATLLFGVPKAFSKDAAKESFSFGTKLKRIDYVGAVTLVRCLILKPGLC